VLATTRLDYRNELVRLATKVQEEPAAATYNLNAVLASIASCVNRGMVLPVSLQPECGCAELTECRAGRGAGAGGVTLQECIACVVERS